MPPILSPDQQILLILGRAGQVKHPTVLDNIENCNTLAISSEDIEELIHGLLEYTEQMEKDGEVDSILPMIKCFELAKRLDGSSSHGLKMLVLARLTHKLESSGKDHRKVKLDGIMTSHINKAKTALYTTLAF